MKRTLILAALFLAAPVQAQDMPLHTILVKGETWKPVNFSLQSCAGIAADRDGTLYLADPKASVIHRIESDGKPGKPIRTSQPVHFLALGPAKTLYAAQPMRVVKIDPEGKETPICENLATTAIAVRADGSFFATDPQDKAVHVVSLDGNKRKVTGFDARPNSLALWGDGGTLVISEPSNSVLWTYRVEADGSLNSKDRYYAVRTLPGESNRVGAMTVDAANRLYAPTPAGVHIWDPIGRLCGVLLNPEGKAPLGVAFGGTEGNLLYVITADRVYVRPMQAKALRGK